VTRTQGSWVLSLSTGDWHRRVGLRRRRVKAHDTLLYCFDDEL